MTRVMTQARSPWSLGSDEQAAPAGSSTQSQSPGCTPISAPQNNSGRVAATLPRAAASKPVEGQKEIRHEDSEDHHDCLACTCCRAPLAPAGGDDCCRAGD